MGEATYQLVQGFATIHCIFLSLRYWRRHVDDIVGTALSVTPDSCGWWQGPATICHGDHQVAAELAAELLASSQEVM
jgi:hypothetical protein